MPDKKYISQLNVGGTTYDIKDAEARDLIKGGVSYLGRTTTALTDGATTTPITIITDATTDPVTTKSVTPVAGNMVIYDAHTKEDEHKDLEFI